jgi:hypothetical protein
MQTSELQNYSAFADKKHKPLLDASKEVGLEVNPEKTKYMLMSRCNKAGRNHGIQITNKSFEVRFQVLTAASMMFRIVFWDVLPCKIIVDRQSSLMMEAVRTSETSVVN